MNVIWGDPTQVAETSYRARYHGLPSDGCLLMLEVLGRSGAAEPSLLVHVGFTSISGLLSRRPVLLGWADSVAKVTEERL
jgi:hypothetical protein